MASIDYWYHYILGNLTDASSIPNLLKKEIPSTISLILERACNLQCEHCIYQSEKSSYEISKQVSLQETILHITKQIKNPVILHEGRILRKWHLDVLKKIKHAKIGLIDNGSYVNLMPEFNDFKFDWLDISIDGLEEAHNKQRNNKHSFSATINGLKRAREILKPGARVSALMTLTKLNYKDVKPLADYLFQNKLIDELHITPMSPIRTPNKQIEMNQEEFAISWKQIKQLSIYKDAIAFKIFWLTDLLKLAQIESIPMRTATVAPGVLHLKMEEISVYIYPTSLWPQEGIIIDADGFYRTAYSQQYTLKQLKHLPQYNIMQLTPETDYKEAYRKCVDHWWDHFGKNQLEKEKEFFRELEYIYYT